MPKSASDAPVSITEIALATLQPTRLVVTVLATADSEVQTPEISQGDIKALQSAFVANLSRAHADLNLTMNEKVKKNTSSTIDNIGNPSTSKLTLASTPPKWISETTNNVSFDSQEMPSFLKPEITQEMVEAMEILVEAKTIPLIIQLNDPKKEIYPMRLTLNSLVEQVNETMTLNEEE